ncbi:MAG: helix-turn-helix domain-containing protein [Candidatus Obscuribacterales bacterium]|nr:helix-turn-helix domain-containing protein [Candidatus Obscuribacterales bacterium]
MNKSTLRIQKRLAKNVLRLRTRKGWSQEECAANLDIATAYLSRIERAVVNVTLKNLVKVADGFEIEVHELLKP